MFESKTNGTSQLAEIKKKKKSKPIELLQHPHDILREKASLWDCDVTEREFPIKMDHEDPLKHMRNKFHIPKCITLPGVDESLVDKNEDSIYLCNNSLGLQPKDTQKCIQRELDKWSQMGVCGHFEGEMPWAQCDEVLLQDMADIVGAKSEEVALMNGLTVNIHLLLISFYEPSQTRYKILLEDKAFPSDHYAIESQIELKGYNPKDSMVLWKPRKVDGIYDMEDLINILETEGDSIAVVLLSGVQYYSGQLFDMEAITKVAHKKGCMVGFDLAHAVGNVPLHIHDWGLDFACWCTYKYLSSGAGGIAGAYIHERHAKSKRYRLTGWWSHRLDTRFNMDNVLDLSEGVSGYRICNPSMLQCASLQASLQIYSDVGMEVLRKKSVLLTGYLELLLNYTYPKPKQYSLSNSTGSKQRPYVQILTPADPLQRGCQLSVMFSVPITQVYNQLKKRGIVVDHRKPYVLRVAPSPLCNSYSDVYKFVQLLGEAMKDAQEVNNQHTSSAQISAD